MDEKGNKTYKNKKTGKEHKSMTVEVECMEGGRIRVETPEQIEAHRKYKDLQDAKEQGKFERVRNRELSFYFVLSKDRRGVLKPQTIARLFYLATFLHYEHNTLCHSDGTPIRKQELPALIGISSYTFNEFWKETYEKYIFVQADDSLTISAEFFRGHLTKHDGYQKVFIKSLRELYHQTPATKHRYLGYLFLILPYINWEFNVLCRNPWEKELDKIEVMTLEEFCNEIGYCGKSNRNCNKLLEAYRKLVFTWDGKQQEVCNYLVSQTNGKKYLVVNPYVVYRGHERRNVEAFGVFFQNRPRQKKRLTKSS